MEHNGTEYSVVQTVAPRGWKWTIHLPGRNPKIGRSVSRAMAIAAAKVAIGKAVRGKIVKADISKAVPPRDSNPPILVAQKPRPA